MRAFTRGGGFGLGVLLLLVLAGCASAGPSLHAQPAQSHAPLSVRLEADRFEFTTPGSMCSTVLTAEVVVGAHGTSHWNSPDGQRPQIADASALIQQGYEIYTPVTFSSLHPLVDHRVQPTAEYVLIGGKVGQDTFSVDPFPQVADGGHYLIVFGPGSQPEVGKDTRVLVIYAAYPVDSRGMVTLQHAGSPNEPGSGQPQPEITLSLTDLRQQLASCH